MLWHKAIGAGGVGGAGSIESVTYLGFDTSTANPVSPFTSGSITFGSAPTAGKKRYIVASITFTQIGTSGSYSFPFSVTIGGNSATWVTGAQGSNLHNVYGLCYAEVPTGTSGTVEVTFTGSGGTSHLIYLHSIITNGAGNLSATDSFAKGPLTTTTTTVSLASNSGDVVVAGLVVRNGTSTPTLTDTSGFGFSGWDANEDQQSTEYTSVASALTNFTGSGTFSITDAVADLSSSAIVAATFSFS